MCLSAVKINGHNLKYVKDKKYEIFLEAVNNNGLALEEDILFYIKCLK